MYYDRLIDNYEEINSEEVKVYYNNGEYEIVTDNTKDIDARMELEAKLQLKNRHYLNTARTNKFLSLLWVGTASIQSINLLINKVNIVPVICSLTCTVLYTLSSIKGLESFGVHKYPSILLLKRLKNDLDKYEEYFDNKELFKEYYESLEDDNFKDTEYDGTFKSIKQMKYKNFKKLLKKVQEV